MTCTCKQIPYLLSLLSLSPSFSPTIVPLPPSPSSCNRFCNPRDLEVLDEVEYCIVHKNGKLSADEIKKLAKGTISAEVNVYVCVCMYSSLCVWYISTIHMYI